MAIRKLPQHLINKLKAGEIVERPVAIVKELVENALDAGATRIHVALEKGGKKLLKISDNGSGIAAVDMPMTIERYATSKISDREDVENIQSYGFRGEALASIAEVSSFRLQSKTVHEPVGTQLFKDGEVVQIKQMPFAYEQGTTVMVEHLFQTIPAREKFLKSDATEWLYIKKLMIQYALIHRDKERIVDKDGKRIFAFMPAQSLLERALDITQPEREGKLKPIEYRDEQLHIYGLVGDASLHFPQPEYLFIAVNGRPLEDRITKKAIYEAYQRQIVPGTSPFAIVFLDIQPHLVDVNVHPRKQEVKFLDPGSVFTRVKNTIASVLGTEKVNYAAFTRPTIQSHAPMTNEQFQALKSIRGQEAPQQSVFFGAGDVAGFGAKGIEVRTAEVQHFDAITLGGESVQILGQLRESYIVAQSQTAVYYIDQHALAERITFERMKRQVRAEGFTPEVLLQPVVLTPPRTIDLEKVLQFVNTLGFDISEFGQGKVMIYAVPRVFATAMIELEIVFNFLRGRVDALPEESETIVQDDPYRFLDLILDEILGMKACKASIKAGQRLSMEEMKQLLRDAEIVIEGLFVCQHGRPSVVKVPREQVDRMFER